MYYTYILERIKNSRRHYVGRTRDLRKQPINSVVRGFAGDVMAFIKNKADAKAWQAANEKRVPRVGQAAPDFELGDISGAERIRLSDAVADKPVALVFGSFT